MTFLDVQHKELYGLSPNRLGNRQLAFVNATGILSDAIISMMFQDDVSGFVESQSVSSRMINRDLNFIAIWFLFFNLHL